MQEMAMEIVKAIFSPIGQCAGEHIWSNLSYIIFHKSKFDNLNPQLHTLEEAKQTLQQRVDDVKRKGENIFVNVQNSLRQANVTIVEANNFVNNEDNARVGCLNGPFPNLCTMHQLGRKSTEMAEKMSEIITRVNEAIKMDTISSLPRLPVEFPQSARGYEPLHSRTSIVNEIMKVLKDDKMHMIGVYGMGGVGKSMLIQEVAWQAEHGDSYGAVIKATVTSSPDVKRIQGQLADGLSLIFKEESEEGRARRLWDRIKNENKILVIMDDLWKKIDLKEVGVPFGDQHKGCKLLLTSRNLHLLKNEMGTQRNFRLHALSEEESWDLFEKTAGDVVKNNRIQPTALEVAGACMGLPLLIVTVSKALKHQEDLYAWRDAFRQLTKYDHEGLSSVENKVVELSYKYLASDSQKSLFLLIGSYGQNYIHIEDLLVYCWGLGLFEHVETLEDARNKLYNLIYNLKASSLLLEGKIDWVRMHDVIREGAAKLASKVQPIFHMQSFTKLKEWPKMDQLRNFKHIFLPWCYISILPKFLECPELKILLLCSKENYLKVPTHFFSRMRDLKVLYLGGMMCTPSLPLSLNLLKKLKALCLYKCILEDITIVSKLTGLELLSFEDSEIRELPKEIGQLTHLRMLNLKSCTSLRLIPANVISSLTSLEELYVGNCYIRWEAEGSDQRNNASLGELRHLQHLSSLELQIHNISNMPRDLLIFGKLENYKILMGDEWRWSWNYAGYFETSRTLKLNLSSTTVTHLDRGIKMLLNKVEDLSLAEVKGARNVIPEFNEEGFAQLKHLLIQNSVEILYIIDSTKWVIPFHSFLCLESLIIRNLINLEKIYYGQLTIHIFTKLQVIKVEGCERLKNLFSFSMARNLPKLLQIEISDCKFMTNVIVEQGEEFEDNAQINFSKIHSIKLESLPNLVSFSSKKSTTDIQSGSNITKYSDNLSYPVALFDEKIAMPNLETMKLSSINMVELWKDISTPSCFQNLTHLTVESCADLKYLFSSLVGKTLVKLQYLEITDCQMMENIFVQDEEYLCKEKSEMQPILQNIETVEINGCPRLKNIIPSSSSGLFQNLDKLWVGYCSGFVNIITSSAARSLVNLRDLWIYNCEMVEEVVASEDDSDGSEIAFMKLEHLQLENLPTLTSFCKENFCFKFPLLQFFYVMECPKMETFSHGILSAPKLTKVRVTPDEVGEWRWEGELNTTIRKVFDEKDSKMATSSMDHS